MLSRLASALYVFLIWCYHASNKCVVCCQLRIIHRLEVWLICHPGIIYFPVSLNVCFDLVQLLNLRDLARPSSLESRISLFLSLNNPWIPPKNLSNRRTRIMVHIQSPTNSQRKCQNKKITHTNCSSNNHMGHFGKDEVMKIIIC